MRRRKGARGGAYGTRLQQGWLADKHLSVLVALLGASAMVGACARSAPPAHQYSSQYRPGASASNSTVDPRYGTSPSPRVYTDGMRIPKGGGIYKVGAPYQIAGRWYTPREEPNYDRTGIASWYGDDFHGRKTANGEIYDMRALTAAHPTLPMPSYAWVTSVGSGRTILVRVNDRGPYAQDRIIDLSKASARALGFEGRGLAQVRVRYAGPAPMNGDDRREQAYLRSQPWHGLAEPVGVAGRRLPFQRPMAGGEAVGGSGARGGLWRPTATTASIDAMEGVPDLPAIDDVRTPSPPMEQGAFGVIAAQSKNRATADSLARQIAPFGTFRVFAVPGRSDPIYEVRADGMSGAEAARLRAQLAGAGFADARIAP